MTSIRAERQSVHNAITIWHMAAPGEEARAAWTAVEDAILALDNAAYDRAYAKVQEEQDAERPAGFKEARDRVHAVIEQWYKAPGPEQARAWRAVEDILWAFDEMAFGRGFEQNRDVVERLKQDLEFTEHRREQAEKELIGFTDDRETLESELADACEEIERLHGSEQHAEIERTQQTVQELSLERGRLTRELADARETIKRLGDQLNQVCQSYARGAEYHAQSRGEELGRLRSALETLADRYHAQMCHKNRRMHGRSRCPYVSAVQDANVALAGESADASGGTVSGGDVSCCHGKIENIVTVSRALTSEEVQEVGHVLFDDRKPKEGPRPFCCVKCSTCGRTISGKSCVRPVHYSAYVRGSCVDCFPVGPEIEAVLMGTEIVCACGCGVTVPAGRCAYRYPQTPSRSMQPLYASEACARKEARPKARTHPPYAAYTDEMRRDEERSPARMAANL